jgi:site-specific DNA-methyltransferase (adenine-specific)
MRKPNPEAGSGGSPPAPARSGSPDRVGGDGLVLGDGLDVARGLPDGCLDLVYLDPPFGSGRAVAGLRGRQGRHGLEGAVAFRDPPSMPAWLAPLLAETRRVLRPGGALFLHLDYRTAHRARSLLDSLYGDSNFLNEIVWHYATGGIPNAWFARKHDTILYYRNGGGHTFHKLKEKKYLKHRMRRRGVEEWEDEGGWFRYRSLDDVWEIPWLTQDSRERTGYPTQKPLALLRRILETATNPGDLVADFCCGSGTTAVAARELGRRCIACDIEELAIRIARRRLALD